MIANNKKWLHRWNCNELMCAVQSANGGIVPNGTSIHTVPVHHNQLVIACAHASGYRWLDDVLYTRIIFHTAVRFGFGGWNAYTVHRAHTNQEQIYNADWITALTTAHFAARSHMKSNMSIYANCDGTYERVVVQFAWNTKCVCVMKRQRDRKNDRLARQTTIFN